MNNLNVSTISKNFLLESVCTGNKEIFIVYYFKKMHHAKKLKLFQDIRQAFLEMVASDFYFFHHPPDIYFTFKNILKN